MRAIFDCDGVLFDSNGLKVDAFERTLARRFSRAVVDEFLDDHKKTGGVSRYVKFQRLAERHVQPGEREQTVTALLEEFSAECRALYAVSALTAGAEECLSWLKQRSSLWVASGSDEAELRMVFADRGLSPLFSAVFGSPTPKPELLRRIVTDAPGERMFFVGDSVKDHEAAVLAGIPCVLMATYSDAADAVTELARQSGAPLITGLAELPALIESGRLWC